MALVNGGYLHYTDKEIHLNSSLKGTRKKIGYGPVINSAERSRALLALLFKHTNCGITRAKISDLNFTDDTIMSLQEHFLSYILTSKVKLMLQGDENQQSLLDFIDTSMKIPEQKLVLEVNILVYFLLLMILCE